MAESQKGASTSDSKKKGSSLDEDFGKDFLSSWKSSKMGKDALDFDVETGPLNKKKSFNFNKLDDFEIGGDFDKLSSFKMDMHDLDFSSPVKKTNKPKDKSCKEFVEGKQESKQENFSFTFDFNELRLDRFNLDSNLLIGEKKSSKFTDGNEHDVSIKNDKVKDSRSNSVMTTDGLEDNETKKLSTSEGMVVSKSEHLIEPNIVHGAGPSTSSNYGHDDVPCEAIVSAEKKTVIVEENKNDTHSTEGHKQHSDRNHRICFTKPHVEKATQDFSIQSVSGDSSAQDARPQFESGLAFLNPVKANCAKELDDSMKSIDSSLSRNSSPVNSYNSRSWPGTSITESPNISGEFQTHHGNNNEVTGGTQVLSESTKGQNDVDNGSGIDSSQKIARELKYTDEKPNSSQMILPSSLHRGSIIVKSMTVNEKATTAIHLKPLSKSADNVSQPSPALTSKLLYSVDGGKIKTMHMCPANENRQSKQNDEVKAEKEKDGILKSYDKGLTKGVAIITRSEKNDNSDTSRFQLHPSNLPWRTTSSSIVKGIVPNLVSGSAPIKCFKNISTEGQGSSVKDDKICDISRMKISGITKLNINASNSTMHKETKSIRFSGRNLEFPLNTASKVASSVMTEKYSLLSPPLKRKTIEESKTDPVILNPVKRVMETSERRKSIEVSPKIDWKLVQETENMEACQDNVSPNNLTSSSGVQEVRSISDFEVPILIENDGNVEKAEACAKELDDICSALKKKHEEAKELLVRAMVNNNTLLMLNHPLFDEKVRALQKFASSLRSKQF